MKRVFYLKTNSLRSKLMWSMMLFLAPSAVLLIYTNFYAINVMRTQVAESNKNIVHLYLNRIDRDLYNIERYLANLISSEYELKGITEGNESEIIMATVRLRKDIDRSEERRVGEECSEPCIARWWP